MKTISFTSDTIAFQVKIKNNEKKYLVTVKSPIDLEQDVKIKGVNLKGFFKLLRIHSIRITEQIASEIEDYLLAVKSKDAKSGCLMLVEEDRDKFFVVQTENGEEKYFAIKKLYDVVKEYNLTNSHT